MFHVNRTGPNQTRPQIEPNLYYVKQNQDVTIYIFTKALKEEQPVNNATN